MSNNTEIKIPIFIRTDRYDEEYYIVGELAQDLTINLKDWIGFIFHPPEDGKVGSLVLRPRKTQEEMEVERGRRNENGNGSSGEGDQHEGR